MPKKYGIALIAALVVFAIAAAIVIFMMMTKLGEPSAEDIRNKAPQATSIRPVALDTKDAFIRYVQTQVGTPGGFIKESNVHAPPEIDWNKNQLVAISFGISSGSSFKKVALEEVDGSPAYVVDVTSPPDKCSFTGQQVQHIAFAVRSDEAVDPPVMIRTTVGTAGCDPK